MFGTGTSHYRSDRQVNREEKLVQKFMDRLNTRNGVQEGETTIPGNERLPTIQVVSWLQVPQILKRLETEGGTGIKLDFPDSAGIPKADELKAFFESFHAKSVAELAQDLAAKIDSSGELRSVSPRVLRGCRIDSGAKWINAFNLDALSLRDKLTVSVVAPVATDNTGTVDKSVLVRVRAAVTAGRPVIYQLDGSQGAASALLEQFASFSPAHPELHKVWIGSATYFPKATGANAVQDIALKDFLDHESRKKDLLEELERLTSRYPGAFFDLKKIQARDFDAKDRNGVTVLENLHTMATAPMIKGVEDHLQPPGNTPNDVAQWRAHLVAAAIERLYHPGRANQDSHGTCGAESIIRLVGFSNPGEWGRLVSDLIVKGECDILPGVTLKPADDWALLDLSKSRDVFDCLMQSALMRRAAEMKGFDYRNADDSFVDALGNIQYELDAAGQKIQEIGADGKPKVDSAGNPVYEKLGGMAEDCAAELLSGLLGETKVPLAPRDLRRTYGWGYHKKIAEMAEQSFGGVFAVLKWGGVDAYHAVVVVGYDKDNDRILFSNPHGEMPGLRNGQTIPGDHNGPERIIVDNEFGLQAMDAKRFKKLFQAAMMPPP